MPGFLAAQSLPIALYPLKQPNSIGNSEILKCHMPLMERIVPKWVILKHNFNLALMGVPLLVYDYNENHDLLHEVYVLSIQLKWSLNRKPPLTPTRRPLTVTRHHRAGWWTGEHIETNTPHRQWMMWYKPGVDKPKDWKAINRLARVKAVWPFTEWLPTGLCWAMGQYVNLTRQSVHNLRFYPGQLKKLFWIRVCNFRWWMVLTFHYFRNGWSGSERVLCWKNLTWI
jgi:hypothetical protein